MGRKITLATVWLQSCSGCHVALFDRHEGMVDLFKRFDVKYSPIMDIKKVPDVDIAIVEGSVANEDNEELSKVVRQRSRLLVALGTCACFGGIPGLRNLFDTKDVLDRSYVGTESTTRGKIPNAPEIPALLPHVKALDQVVKVDAYIPGCPPLTSAIQEDFASLVKGIIPKMKTRNLCEECSRKKEKLLIQSRDFLMDTVLSPHELDQIDPDRCFLEQGVLCMGPATREGCDTRCIKGNMPCRGCMGPTSDALEQGSKIINALSSILPPAGLMFQEDIVGVGYRYSLPKSILPHKLKKGAN
jgi:F420-non-reducing hydrogenase small subunit